MSLASSRSNLYHHSLTLSGIASADDEDFYYCAYLNVSTFDVTKLSDSFELVIAGRCHPFCLVPVHVVCSLGAHSLS